MTQSLEDKNIALDFEKYQFRMDYEVFMGSLVYGISPRKKKIRAVLKASRPSAPTECTIHYLFCGLRKASTTLFQPGGYLLYWTMGRRIISGIQTAFSQGICSSLWRYSCGRWWESFGARYSFGVGEEWRQVFCYASEALAVSKEGTGLSYQPLILWQMRSFKRDLLKRSTTISSLWKLEAETTAMNLRAR